MDSGAKILAKRYARAYMSLDGVAYGATEEEAAAAKLEGLLRVFKTARPHMRILTHPVLNAEVKLDILAKILGASNTGPVAAFAALLVREGRFGLFDDIMQDCVRLHDAFRGVVRAEIYSPYALSEGEVKRITALLTAASGKKVSLRQVVAERVLGGFEIKIGDTVIDASVRGRLAAMKAGLMKA